MELLTFVADGKGDFTFVEPYLTQIFNEKGGVKLKAAAESPIRTYENTFVFNEGDKSLKHVFDAEIQSLKKTGALKDLVKKYTGSENVFIWQ